MTDEQRRELGDEWKRNEARLAELPPNHAERSLLCKRQDEIEYELAADDMRTRRERRAD